MCDPVTIAGAALTAGGMIANSAAESRVAKARQGAMEAERQRQQAYDQEAMGLNDQSRDRYTDFQGQEDQKAQQVSDYFKSQQQPLPQAGTAIPTSASNVVVQERQRALDKARGYGQQQDQALGQLRSFGDLLGGISRDQARDAGQIGIINGFKQGSEAVLPYELEAAKSKGAGLKLFGDILSGAGNIGVAAGLSGAKLPFGSSGPAGMYNGGTGTAANGLRFGGV